MQLRSPFLLMIFASTLPAWSPLCGESLPTHSESATTSYQVRGVLRRFDSATKLATISHDKIPGYMDAMTMDFAVRDPTEMRGLESGAVFTFRLCVTADRAWIENVHQTGTEETPLLVPAAITTREWEIGERLPDIDLVNESGKKIHLADFRGKVLALTFLYTRCPLPTYCPLLNRNFQSAQTLLDRLAPEGKWQFLSISMDGTHDTPEVLAAYAANYRVNAERWTFAVAPEETVRSLGKGVGLEFTHANGQISHNLRTVVIDSSGRIRHVFRGNAWTPQELAAAMRAATRNFNPGK